ncbi:MAG: HAD family hydrolase [Tractidigestivibacter sp.]|jgi:Cof subfamily protein (haloacid dehalogenase superfamily)|uniref:HAD family hydrolase n=1 Tax=Tractidigestivibacter sp. TaxID=2847320 RepID=UPI003D8C14E2
MGRKVIFLDIDGTLVNFSGELPDSARRALVLARQNGHALVICTGRTPTQVQKGLISSGLFDGVVCAAGAEVHLGDKLLLRHFIDQDKLDGLVDYLDSRGTYYFLQGADDMYGSQSVADYRRELFGDNPQLASERAKNFGHVTILDNIHDAQRIEKVVYHRSPDSYDQLRRAVGPDFTVVGSSFGRFGSGDGEIMARGYDKATGMQCLLNAVGVPQKDSIAFGDSENDLAMLEYAGTSVAMGSGSPVVQERADFVTTGVDEDGLWNGFKALGLLG